MRSVTFTNAAVLPAILAVSAAPTTVGFTTPCSSLSSSPLSLSLAAIGRKSVNSNSSINPNNCHAHRHKSSRLALTATLFDAIPANTDFSLTPSLSSLTSSCSLLAFSDQGANLAGTLFQLSLLPYLIFLYFLSFRANRIPPLANFGFQYLLLFVLGTIPAGIVTKGVFGDTLANVDWLHGGAEALLTVTNVLIVLGFRQAFLSAAQSNIPTTTTTTTVAISNTVSSIPNMTPKLIAGLFAISFALLCTFGKQPVFGLEAHSQFLSGIGNLGEDAVLSLPFVHHTEPANALSIPTWAIHFSSIFEYLLAMDLIWKFSSLTNNPRWKGLTWGMLPLHASGVAACTYHFFYNPKSLQFLVELQALFTFVGNITCAIAAYRIAVENGWRWNKELNFLPRREWSAEGVVVEELAVLPYENSGGVWKEAGELSEWGWVVKLIVLTLVSSYLIKYGELALDLPWTENGVAAAAITVGIPAVTGFLYYRRAKQEEGFNAVQQGDVKGLSMADIKKYGVSGTVAYILTELAFWAIAFPVASTALYQTTGHWPDVIHDGGDRAAVLAFVFTGANIARLLVPVRLGVALALAPWVDENIINRENMGASKES